MNSAMDENGIELTVKYLCPGGLARVLVPAHQQLWDFHGEIMPEVAFIEFIEEVHQLEMVGERVLQTGLEKVYIRVGLGVVLCEYPRSLQPSVTLLVNILKRSTRQVEDLTVGHLKQEYFPHTILVRGEGLGARQKGERA